MHHADELLDALRVCDKGHDSYPKGGEPGQLSHAPHSTGALSEPVSVSNACRVINGDVYHHPHPNMSSVSALHVSLRVRGVRYVVHVLSISLQRSHESLKERVSPRRV